MRFIIINKRVVYGIFIAIFVSLLVILILALIIKPIEPVIGKGFDNKLVIIDPGHGGFDPGASSSDGLREDEVVLRISKYMKAELERAGYTVILTRDSDDAIAHTKREDMAKRCDIIKNSTAGAVISIHLNYFPQSKYYGAQTFYHSGSEDSKRLASQIQTSLLNSINDGNKRWIQGSDNLRIIKAGEAPAVMVECGFLSNAEETDKLATDEYQKKLAKAIFIGIDSFLR